MNYPIKEKLNEEKNNSKTYAKSHTKTQSLPSMAIRTDIEQTPKSAICITFGKQSANRVGMQIIGNGPAEKGFSGGELKDLLLSYTTKKSGTGCLLNCLTLLNKKDRINTSEAYVLVLRNAIKTLAKIDPSDLHEELSGLKWDTTHYSNSKWVRSIARHNLCFGHDGRRMNRRTLSGTIISYKKCPLLTKLKNTIEDFTGTYELEAEGNYYDAEKTGIDFHGDAERKITIGCNVSDEDVKRELHFQWYVNNKPIGTRLKISLSNGDCYIMSEKATGWDWKTTKDLIFTPNGPREIPRKTLRHAAGMKSSKFLK